MGGSLNTLQKLHGDFEGRSVPLRLQAAEVREEGVEPAVQQRLIAAEVRHGGLELVDLQSIRGVLSNS